MANLFTRCHGSPEMDFSSYSGGIKGGFLEEMKAQPEPPVSPSCVLDLAHTGPW